jgi:hypothetical protein
MIASGGPKNRARLAVQALAYYHAHREHIRANNDRTMQTPERRAAAALSCTAARKRYPERTRAHWLVAAAVRDGRLIPMPCEVCGAAKAEFHHPDYGEPLEGNWLCKTHHRKIHKDMQAETEGQACVLSM